MTVNPENPESGLDRESNERADVNEGALPEQQGRDPQEERRQELEDAAKED